jgi:hypothetical protein
MLFWQEPEAYCPPVKDFLTVNSNRWLANPYRIPELSLVASP